VIMSAMLPHQSSPQELEFHLRQVVDSVPTALFMLDESHAVTHWNLACERLTKIGAERMVGWRDVWRVFHLQPRPLLANVVIDGAGDEVMRGLFGDGVRASTEVTGGWEVVSYSEVLGRRLLIAAAPILDLGGRVVGALQTAREV